MPDDDFDKYHVQAKCILERAGFFYERLYVEAYEDGQGRRPGEVINPLFLKELEDRALVMALLEAR